MIFPFAKVKCVSSLEFKSLVLVVSKKSDPQEARTNGPGKKLSIKKTLDRKQLTYWTGSVGIRSHSMFDGNTKQLYFKWMETVISKHFPSKGLECLNFW